MFTNTDVRREEERRSLMNEMNVNLEANMKCWIRHNPTTSDLSEMEIIHVR